MLTEISVDSDRIAAFRQRNRILRLAFFGPVLRDDFSADSGVDVLVEFEPDAVVGLIRLAGMERCLSDILGRKADMRTQADLSRYFRDEVVRSSEVVYGG